MTLISITTQINVKSTKRHYVENKKYIYFENVKDADKVYEEKPHE